MTACTCDTTFCVPCADLRNTLTLGPAPVSAGATSSPVSPASESVGAAAGPNLSPTPRPTKGTPSWLTDYASAEWGTFFDLEADCG